MIPLSRYLQSGLIAVFFVLLLFIASSRSSQGREAGGTPGTQIRISPVTQGVTAGSNVPVTVLVDNVAAQGGLGSYEFTLGFDPNVLSFDNFTNASFLGSTGREVTCLPPLFDVDGDATVDPGFVRVGCVTTGPDPAGPTGSSILATVTFSTSCSGSSDIDVARAGLSDPLGADIPAETSGGAVTVSGGPECPVQGDANCDNLVNSIDAALVLQFGAGLVSALDCQEQADANKDGTIDAVDAALILQFTAGLVRNLPP